MTQNTPTGRLVLHTIALLPALLAASCEPAAGRHYFRDSENRIVMYRGICVANTAKTAPDFLPWQTKEDFARLKEWGFNLVRYQVFWAAIEPEEGLINDAYLDATAERIQWLRDLGVDVFLDVHQDLYAAKFSGNGFPAWTIHDSNVPFHLRSPWNANYLEPAVLASYAYFWNSEELQAKYIAMLERLLHRFGEFPNVIGVDVMNEPFPGLNLSFESKQLSPFYEKTLAMWRESKTAVRLFFEPMMFNSAGIPTMLSFKPDAGCVFAPHYYGPLVHEGAPYTALSRMWMALVFKQRVRDAQRFGTPLVFGEFGIAADVRGYLRYLDDFANLADRYGAAWTYYSFDKSDQESFGILDEQGRDTERAAHLVRPYAQRIAGERPEMRLCEKSFDVSYDAGSSDAPSVVFVPSRYSGVRISINGIPFSIKSDSLCFDIPNQVQAGKRQVVHVSWD